MKLLRFRVVEKPLIIKCGDNYPVESSTSFPSHFIWINPTPTGVVKINNLNGIPIKVSIRVDGVLIETSPYFGNVAFQSDLDIYNTNNYLPIESIDNNMNFPYPITGLNASSVIDIKVYSPLHPGNFNVFIECG